MTKKYVHLPIIDQLIDGSMVYHCRCGEHFESGEDLLRHYRVNNQ